MFFWLCREMENLSCWLTYHSWGYQKLSSWQPCVPIEISTHLPLVPLTRPLICVSESGQHWLKLWFVTYSAPSHYLNQCRVIVNLTNFCEILIKILNFLFTKMYLNITSEKCGHFVQGAVSIRKTVSPGMAIPMLKIRRPNGRLIFNMEIAIRR